MTNPLPDRDPASSTSGRLAASMLTLRIGLCLVAMWAIFALIVYETRRHAWAEASRLTADLVNLIEATIAREIEVYDLSVQSLATDSTDRAILALPEELRRKALFDQSSNASDLGRLLVVDATGRVIVASRDNGPLGLDLSDRDYFAVQRDRPDAGLFVGGPFVSRLTHEFSIGLSRRRAMPEGRFNGIVVGTIQLRFFQKLFDSIRLPPNSSVTLMRQDGTIMTRVPFRPEYIGRSVAAPSIREIIVGREAGTYRRIAETDGLERLFAYRRIGELPMYVTIGLTTEEILGEWRWEMLVIGSGFALLNAVIVLLGLNLGGELRRRNSAERRLAELASTDYLTMLANRRRFDEILDAEWRRGARAQSPLSLLMVDGDFFKSFNDTYGHLAGDRVLRSIALALKACVERPGDLVARYGGEEFAVLLPSTNDQGAMIVAASIRAAVNALDLVHAAAPSGRLTVSIGVACLTPDASSSSDALVEAADKALYLAKGEGRDRIVRHTRDAKDADILLVA